MHSWYLKGKNEVEDLFLCWSSLTVFQHAITCFNEGCKLWARACTFFLLKMEWAQQSSRATTYRDCSSWQQKLKILCATIKTQCSQIDIKKKKKKARASSLASQWERICLPMQEAQIQSLVQEDPTCHGIPHAKPVGHNYWSPYTLEPGLHNRETAAMRKPYISTRGNRCSARKTQYSQK